MQFLQGFSSKRTLFIVSALSARPVAEFSIFPHEAESILLPATKLKVISNKPHLSDPKIQEITLEEVEIIPESK